MIRLCTSALLILTTLLAFSQGYYVLITEASQLYDQKNYSESSSKWKEAFNIHSGFATDYYNAACTEALAGNAKQAFTYLKIAIEKGWTDIEWLKKDADLNSLRLTGQWEKFLNKIPEIQSQKMKEMNIELKNQLEDLRMQDQVVRLLLPDAEKRFGRESSEYEWFRGKLMQRNDSIVLDETIKIIDEQGWVSIDEVGELANQALWLIIQHAPLETQEKYLPILEESVKNGESKGWQLAFLQDRILMRRDKNQIYGTQSRWNTELKKNVIYPVQDPSEINQLRKSVGLESIEDYATKNGYLYDQ